MKRKSSESDPERPTTSGVTGIPSQASNTSMAHEKSQKRVGKRPGRKPSKIDQKAKLERSRQSARECRARKKLRYQYLEELVSSREKAVFSLREEVEMYKRWSIDLDRGIIPDGLLKLLEHEELQKSLKVQASPPSQHSTPTASPSSVDTEYSSSQPFGAQPGRAYSTQSGQQTGQMLGHQPGQIMGQQQGQSRRQQLVKQPSMNQPAPQVLSSMNRGSRSFEESSLSSSTSSSMYRSGSVPNLATTSSQNLQQVDGYPAPAVSSSATLVYRDLEHQDNTTLSSTGFVPDTTLFSTVSSDSQGTGNIPTIVSHQSPPSAANQPGAAWTWGSGEQFSSASHGSQLRTYPITCASSVTRTPQSAHLAAVQSFTSNVFNTDSSMSTGASFPVTSGTSSVSGGTVRSSAVPYYQRPRSSSDLARKVTSSAVSSSSVSSTSQQHLPGLFDPVVTSYGSQDIFPTLSDSVATCLTLRSVPQDSAPVSVGSDLSASISAVQASAPVCVGSELSASISEPIPHWYSFLDDLESAATFSARQGAFSDAGTPGSTRTRSGAGTPSSVDSPYSQHLQQQQQQQGSGNDGNIPNIISDLLGNPPPS